MNEKNWQWNEFKQVGTDYESETEVAVYDKRMRQLRDIDSENRHILDLLRLPKQAEVLEIGTGTGAFIRMAAEKCRHAVGIDISPVMLRYAASKAVSESLENIDFSRAGFLTFDYGTERFDGIVSGMAFHHLPDTWKAIALSKIHAALKPGGRFVLLDVVFDWAENSPEEYFENLLTANESVRSHFECHIAQEYSTLSWIMTGLFERAGFVIESDCCTNNFLHTYCARK